MKNSIYLSILLSLGLIMSCAHVKNDEKKATTEASTDAKPGMSVDASGADLKAVKGPPPVYHPLTNDDEADKPDSIGVIRGRYYGEGLDVLLGRTIRWMVENGWAILNDGAGANGVVVARGKLKAYQRLYLDANKKLRAEKPCADCGVDSTGTPYVCEEGNATIKVKTIGYGKTKVVVNFVPIPPDGVSPAACRSTGRFEQVILNYLLVP